MNSGRIDPNLPLELLNGAGMVLEFCFLAMMLMYLWREAARRQLRLADWLAYRLPPSMNFAVAVLACDGGVWLRAIVIWAWRRFFGAGDFSLLQIVLLGGGAAAIVVGSLCKIRAISKPEYGDWPWLASAGATALFVSATLYFR